MPVQTVAFVANHASKRYRGGISDVDIVSALSSAKGGLGTGLEYLEETLSHLRGLGLSDGHLEELSGSIQLNSKPR
ncbi:gamma-glutamylcyclotransferase [Candidatus Phyllobacterium onerii]|uniref:gamma-glutamylcyclotransferase n=1 Tax=Candidatus Phyllobacterium onerii TaxID=3020828 RepID=UPI003A87DC3D